MMTYYTLISTVLLICLLLMLIDTWSKLAHSEHKTIFVKTRLDESTAVFAFGCDVVVGCPYDVINAPSIYVKAWV